MKEIISAIIEVIPFICLVCYVLVDKYRLFVKDATTLESVEGIVDDSVDLYKNMSLLFDFAKKFVVLAKKTFADGSGEEKRNFVITNLKKLCKNLNLSLSDEELLAINEEAYMDMKEKYKDVTN